LIESTFLSKYEKEMVENIKRLRPKMKEKDILKAVRKQISSCEKLQEDNQELVLIDNNYKKQVEETSLLSVMDYYLDKKPIMTGYGVMFKQHDKAVNLNADFVSWLLAERKVAKGIQFEGLNEKDAQKESFGLMLQKTYKLLNNSYYGVTGQSKSQFYNEVIPASVTYTGYQIITSSILGFEMMLSNNVHYDNFTDLSIYLNRILRDRHSNPEIPSILEIIDEDKIPSPNDVYQVLKFLTDKKLNKDELQEVKNLLKKMSKEDLSYIYYTNNLFKFLENSGPSELIRALLEVDIQNPAKIDDDTKAIVESLWTLIKNYVSYDYQIFQRQSRAFSMERESIITVDTDSNFLSLNKWVQWVKDQFDIEINSDNFKQEEVVPDEMKLFTIINIAVLLLSRYVQMVLNRFTHNCNVNPEKQPIINMKSEYFYPRILLTRNKKQYCGYLRLQEGNLITKYKQQIDMKGMSIKKASVNNRTREVFTNLIDKNILRSKTINLAEILGLFIKFEAEIRNSLMNGETTFLTPAKVNDIGSYKLPQQMPVVRGSLVWNELYPENKIQIPDKINLLKIKGGSIQDLKPIYGTKEFEFLQEYCFTPPTDDSRLDLTNYGFNILALPKSEEKIPEWVIPLIDINTIVDDNIRPGILILQSLGLKIMKYNNSEYYSNFINF
jgi:hypothetical protein